MLPSSSAASLPSYVGRLLPCSHAPKPRRRFRCHTRTPCQTPLRFFSDSGPQPSFSAPEWWSTGVMECWSTGVVGCWGMGRVVRFPDSAEATSRRRGSGFSLRPAASTSAGAALACISRRLSAASPGMSAPATLRSLGPSRTAAQDEPPQPRPRLVLSLSKGRKPCIHRPLRRFATTVGEKRRLACARRCCREAMVSNEDSDGLMACHLSLRDCVPPRGRRRLMSLGTSRASTIGVRVLSDGAGTVT
jgi:hypothetical protein